MDLAVTGLYKEYADAITELPHGEYLQIKARKSIQKLPANTPIPYNSLWTEYFEKTHFKTGSLFTHLLRGTGLICGLEADHLHQIDRFAFNLGLSFQIADDLKDIV